MIKPRSKAKSEVVLTLSDIKFGKHMVVVPCSPRIQTRTKGKRRAQRAIKAAIKVMEQHQERMAFEAWIADTVDQISKAFDIPAQELIDFHKASGIPHQTNQGQEPCQTPLIKG